MTNTNLVAVFLTGLLTGGLTCMAVQGGLLAATIAQREQEHLKDTVRSGHGLPILAFLTTKLLAYTLLGALLGWLGSFFQLSLHLQVLLQVIVIIFMLGTAGNILNLHPIFRYFVIQPPRFITRLVRKESKSADIFAPALLGALTVFIPCGTTQAMMALAVASGTPLLGAAILFAFVLGTSPVFFLLGYFATKLGSVMEQAFMKVAAYAIILLALFNFNSVLALSGSSRTLGSIAKDTYCTFAICSDEFNVAAVQPVSTQEITINGSGYSPLQFAVKAGSRVTINLKSVANGGCAQDFTIPSLNIQQLVPIGGSRQVTFTAPSQPGKLAFMCGMGMHQGTINVI